ncbi:MAG TPA: DedA family protein [Candidatus Dormibacteraeota bacterium]|nr:DedA family protein [Candidatus Dormibacteraeota bacterium]
MPVRQYSRAFQISAIALIVVAAIVLIAFFYDDVPEAVQGGGRIFRAFFHRNQFVPGYVLLYLEESGIPLPAPGDVYVMYVGVHVPHRLAAWITAWLGLILIVVLGATNLFFISRRFGRRLAESEFAEYVHLNHQRLLSAEQWFRRYGVLAIIFGRHIPGFRIPITVAAGIFQVPYRVFAPSVAVSTAIWAGIVLIIGINFGPRLGDLLRAHSFLYFVWVAIVGALTLSVYIRQRRRRGRRMGAVGKPDRPVESPSS